MNTLLRTLPALLLAVPLAALSAEPSDDELRAIEVLNASEVYVRSVDRWHIKVQISADATLDHGLMVANQAEVTIDIAMPHSLKMQTYDGMDLSEIYFHEGRLTVNNRTRGMYAQAEVPMSLTEAMPHALDSYGVETPLGDLFFSGRMVDILLDGGTAMYLTDKSRVAGVDCHHLAVRGPDADVQLWIAEGDRPLVKKMMLTMKWLGGSPRRTVQMEWTPSDSDSDDLFTFEPTEDSVQIQFLSAN